ncbi:MAG: hypothetical protein JSW00_01790 [Thermoplasmata archaeon]|nr:MAG: hypothetical protein JSW00_01790 [Thermoplasmata archaeon]
MRRNGKVKREKKSLKQRIVDFSVKPEFIGRMRLILYVIAFLLLFLAFQVGDDWFVREFANYDWARSIGY